MVGMNVTGLAINFIANVTALTRADLLGWRCPGISAAALCAALEDARHFAFSCPQFAYISRQFRSLYRDPAGPAQCFVWHKHQKAACHW